jgi:hypothetical protein
MKVLKRVGGCAGILSLSLCVLSLVLGTALFDAGDQTPTQVSPTTVVPFTPHASTPTVFVTPGACDLNHKMSSP